MLYIDTDYWGGQAPPLVSLGGPVVPPASPVPIPLSLKITIELFVVTNIGIFLMQQARFYGLAKISTSWCVCVLRLDFTIL